MCIKKLFGGNGSEDNGYMRYLEDLILSERFIVIEKGSYNPNFSALPPVDVEPRRYFINMQKIGPDGKAGEIEEHYFDEPQDFSPGDAVRYDWSDIGKKEFKLVPWERYEQKPGNG